MQTCLPSAAPPAPPPQRSLAELDSFLGARLLRLEINLGRHDGAVLVEARVVRGALAEAGRYADVPPGAHSCEAALGETLRGVYAWVFGALDAIFLDEYARPLPRRVVTELADHGSLASIRTHGDPSLAPLEPILLELTRACTRLAEPR